MWRIKKQSLRKIAVICYLNRIPTLFLLGIFLVVPTHVVYAASSETSSSQSDLPNNPGIVYASPDMDFAQIDYQFPLSPADLMTITPATLKELEQEHIDQLYARLTAGPIPDGSFDGMFFLPKHQKKEFETALIFLQELTGSTGEGLMGQVKRVWSTLWQGKAFDKKHRMLRNRINIKEWKKLKVNAIPAFIGKKFQKSLEKYHSQEEPQLFPAKVYCGQSRIDSRRESIILDYAYFDEIEGYDPEIDYLAGRDGFKIRDEIRMVRPGFYLGRAYMDKLFVLNFTLYNEDIVNAQSENFQKTGLVNEDCLVGSQRMTMKTEK